MAEQNFIEQIEHLGREVTGRTVGQVCVHIQNWVLTSSECQYMCKSQPRLLSDEDERDK